MDAPARRRLRKRGPGREVARCARLRWDARASPARVVSLQVLRSIVDERDPHSSALALDLAVDCVYAARLSEWDRRAVHALLAWVSRTESLNTASCEAAQIEVSGSDPASAAVPAPARARRAQVCGLSAAAVGAELHAAFEHSLRRAAELTGLGRANSLGLGAGAVDEQVASALVASPPVPALC